MTSEKNQLGGDDRFFTITHDFHTITKITFSSIDVCTAIFNNQVMAKSENLPP